MGNLYRNDKHNIIYNLSKCVVSGDDGKCRLPLDRMPYGLLSHNIMFFASENASNLMVEDHYSEWLTTMFTHFGHKWAALYNGPMWSRKDTYTYENQNEDSTEIPGKASCNIIEQAFAETVGDFNSFSLPSDCGDNSVYSTNAPSLELEDSNNFSRPGCNVLEDEGSSPTHDNSNYVSTLVVRNKQ